MSTPTELIPKYCLISIFLDCPKIIKEKGDEDSEHRVYYVGATRARKSLHVVEPRDGNGYRI